MNEIVRVGIIGFGFAARTFHAPVLTTIPNLKLQKIVSRSGKSDKERYPYVEFVNEVDNLYEDSEIDLIIITTPSTDHFSFVREALLAGKHVVVEKPFTITTAEADMLISLAKKMNRMLSIFHNRRWDGDFLTIQNILKEKLLGRIIEVEFRWDRFSPIASTNWRDSSSAGSGQLYDLGVHLLDQALCLFGKPKTIHANLRRLRPNTQADDYFDVTLGYTNELNVRLKSSLVAKEPGPRYTIHGTSGSFIKYGIDPQEEALKQGLAPRSPDWGRETKEWWGTLNTDFNKLHIEGRIETLPGSYDSYYQNIYEHIMGREDLAVKPEQARLAILLIEMAKQSHIEKRTLEVT
ncbi:oxidoreductase [Bacillus sp. SA1-12]|uniref:oxidoreductase n=1 Tax=Bacillus sp. SA1-12 TaxID=1455638 RepID=UPI00062722E9|nr:oxidoreductase [Bacillus sp. SA1-12]KKI90103.1 oxidoreductase [Bacillus sp. SA1-12]